MSNDLSVELLLTLEFVNSTKGAQLHWITFYRRKSYVTIYQDM